jgi:hypothetical protein
MTGTCTSETKTKAGRAEEISFLIDFFFDVLSLAWAFWTLGFSMGLCVGLDLSLNLRVGSHFIQVDISKEEAREKRGARCWIGFMSV